MEMACCDVTRGTEASVTNTRKSRSRDSKPNSLPNIYKIQQSVTISLRLIKANILSGGCKHRAKHDSVAVFG